MRSPETFSESKDSQHVSKDSGSGSKERKRTPKSTYSHQKCAADFRRASRRKKTAVVAKHSSTPVLA